MIHEFIIKQNRKGNTRGVKDEFSNILINVAYMEKPKLFEY